MRRLLPLAALALLASAQDEEVPRASVVLRVVGSDGKPLAGVRVRAKGDETAAHVSDPAGVVRLDLPVPLTAMPPAFGWEIDYDLTLDSYAHGWARVRPFRGARIERTVLLRRSLTMRIKVLGPGDEPVRNASAHVSWSSPDHGGAEVAEAAVDGSGVLSFAYAEGVERVDVSVGGWSGRLRPGASAMIHLAARDLPAEEEVPSPPPPEGPALVGVLLHQDGTPAKGWSITADVVSWGGVGSNYSYTTLYKASDVRKVDEAGRFSTTPSSWSFRPAPAGSFAYCSMPSGLLAVFSPEGLPMLYGLNPGSWEERPRRIVLRLPPATEPLRGVVVDPKGKPLVGVAIVPRDHRGRTDFSWWSLSADAPFSYARSDAGGAFAVPMLRGQDLLFRYEKEGYGDWDSSHEEDGRVVLVRKPTKEELARKEAASRHLILDVRDTQGRRVERLSMYAWWPYGGAGSTGMPGHEYYEDERGLHIFMGAEHSAANGIDFRLESPGWETYPVCVPLGKGQLQEAKVVWPDELRQRPLRGRLYGTDGEPVRGSVVTVKRPEGWVLGLESMTDDEGRFAFPYAPRPCRLAFDGATAEHRRTRLPGWLRDREVAPDEEEIVVRLERGGSVKLLVPKGRDASAPWIYLVAEDQSQSLLEATDEPGVLRVSHLRPGAYRCFAPADLELEDRTISVEARKETVVDASRAVRAPRPEPVWHQVTCTEKLKPVPGADVWVFADSDSDEPGQILLVARDLTDDTGRIRFQLNPGRSFYVVARCAGRLTGLVAPPVDERTTTLVLRPVRSLRVRAPQGDTSPATIRLLGRGDRLAQAATEALGPAAQEPGLAHGESVAYDLTVGFRYEVSTGTHTREVTIEPGDGDQVLDLE